MPGKIKTKGRILLVLGGARSGKSSYAQRLVESTCRHPCYLATAEILDEEMRERIRLHQARRGRHWRCVEEPLEIARVLRKGVPRCDGILLDCVTIWLSNVMLKEGLAAVARRKAQLIKALKATRHNVIMVSNEVGLGIVPENALARQFRDQAGWLNQELGVAADTVVLVTAGFPVFLKGTAP